MAKYKRLVLILLCLSSVLISGESNLHLDLGVLDDVGPAGYKQDPAASGQKDSVQAEFSPVQQLLPSPQPDLQSTAAEKDQDVSSLYSKVSDGDVLQTHLNSNKKEGSQKNLTDLTDASDRSFLDTKIISGSKAGLKTHNSSADQDLAVSGSLVEVTKQSDEPSEPNRPDSVEITLSNMNLKSEQKLPNTSNGVNDSIFQDSQNKLDQYSTDAHEEDDRSYGNPPILWDSDELDTLKNISDLSSEERETLRAKLSEELGLSAVDPGLAMLPLEQNFQAPASEGTSTPGSTFNSYTTTSSTTESSKSLEELSFHTESSVWNIINNFVETESAKESQVNIDDKVNIDSRDGDNEFVVENYREIYGRKVLNEGNLDNLESKTKDDNGFNIDSYFYEDYDKDEDDYVGGEVLAPVSPKSARLMDQTKNVPGKKLEMTKDDIAKSGEAGKNQQTGDVTTEFNHDKVFSYEEYDGNWYYDPEEAAEVKETVDLRLTTIFKGGLDHNIPVQDKAEDANGSPSETKTEVTFPELKEGVVNKQDLPPKKVLQAPKGTIILYTALIVILIAGFVLFSIWKSPFQNGRPVHQPMTVRTGEEGKRLLDHPFV